MPSGSIRIKNNAYLRDEMGRFLSSVSEGAQAALEEIGRRMVEEANKYAQPWITGSFGSEISGNYATLYSDHPWALGADLGIPAHWIGEDGATLANRELDFGPVRGPVHHPGVKAAHFFEKAYASVGGRALKIYADHLPG